MLFTRLVLFAIPFLGALAAPTGPGTKVNCGVGPKRDSIFAIVKDLDRNIKRPIALINAANAGKGTKTLTADNAQIYLQDIVSQISTANEAIGSVNKRDLNGLADLQAHVARAKLECSRQTTEDDLEEVGAVPANIITEIVEAIEGIADELKFLPIVGALIFAIDDGLSTLLLGVEIVLVGVVQILQGLLGALGGLLGSLGAGLLAGILF